MVKETIIFALTSSVDLASKIAEDLELPLGKIKVDHFADGEILVTPQETVRGRSVFVVQSTCTPVTERLMEVLVCIDALKRASAAEINVIMPYYGYARQDRKADAHQPITAKLVADLLQVAGASRVLTIDIHAPQIQGYFDIPVDDLTAVPMLGYNILKNIKPEDEFVVVSPDHGGVVRARRLAEILQAPLAIVDKRRPRPNEVEAQNVIGDVAGKTAIVVDDICDTAGSLCAACKIISEHGANKVYAAVTHGIFSRDAVDKINASPIEKIYVTDTIPLNEKAKECDKIVQLSVADMVAQSIDAIQNHKSVSRVYDLYESKKLQSL
jgi:ribose-phosphate pyrophosphokinase